MDWINGLFSVRFSPSDRGCAVADMLFGFGIRQNSCPREFLLASAFVFFIGIIAGHLGLNIDAKVLEYTQTFGLVLFVYTLGLHVGPNFFGSLRQEGIRLNLWGLAVIALGTILALVLAKLCSVPLQTMVGILCGVSYQHTGPWSSPTSTRKLWIFHPKRSPWLCRCLSLRCAWRNLRHDCLRKFFVKPEDLVPHSPQDEDHTYVAQYEIVNQAIHGKTLAEIAQMAHIQFIVSRIWRNEQVIVPPFHH